jgi:SAM-dependent methyltransferase
MSVFEKAYFENSQCSFYREGYSYEMFRSHWEEKLPYLLRRARPARALDVGCAKGFLVDMLRRNGVEAFGADVSEYALDAAPQEVRPHLRRANICEDRLPVLDNHFDLVTCLEVIEHLPDPSPALKETTRVLASRGLAFFSTPSPDEEEEKLDKTHCSIFSLALWVDIFDKCGLKLRRIPAWRLAGNRGRLGSIPLPVRATIRHVYYPLHTALVGEQNRHLFLEARKKP